jgi:4-amino-4-deoxy-L-arabinose transferase-like glycosyltransferase
MHAGTSSVLPAKAGLASRLPAFWCALGFLVAELLSSPHAELGIADDWSYLRTVQVLVQTGHLHYNGYATAMIGWQFYLAAGFVRIFGFSFTAVRASTLLVGVITTFLIERLFVRACVRQRNAVIGTLALVLTPLYMPLSVSFMSDIQGLLALVMSLYCCLRALQASGWQRTLGWVTFAVASDLVIGSSRQIAWLGILVFVPATLWLMRKDRKVLLPGSVITLIGAALVAFCLHWFGQQPYSVPEHIMPEIHKASQLAYMASQLTRTVLEIPFLLLPISVAFFSEIRYCSRRTLMILAACGIAYLALALVVLKHHGPNTMLEPLLRDWVSPYGFYESLSLNNAPPIVLGTGLRMILTLLSLGGTLCFFAALYRVRASRSSRAEEKTGALLSWRTLLTLVVPFTLVYFLLLIPRSAVQLLDRYLVALLLVFALVAIRFYQDFIETSLPTTVVIAVAVLALYGIGATHDMFAFYRARVKLVNELRTENVPANAIDGGLEYNGWVELEQSSHVNDSRLINPSGAYQHIAGAQGFDCQSEPKTSSFLPHFAPLYGVSFDADACMGPAPVAPVSYFRWLGMTRTSIYAVRYQR